MKNPSPKKLQTFQNTVWDFYRAHKRVLPWRTTKDPYKIFVSEFMLQQTQVSRVLIKYPEFIQKFPNIQALAEAPLASVIRTWQGLGYNRRAKFLKQAAEAIVRSHKDKIPNDFETLQTLPGIGPSTAGGICAFAFNRPFIFIETNIRRVYIHHFFKDRRGVTDAQLAPLIEKTLPKENPREWYWALMDYGSHLPKQTINPNRNSAHYTRQSAFKGSQREVRGAILRLLSKEKRITLAALNKELGFAKERTQNCLSDLSKEGFVRKLGRAYELA